jgi:hypothetical protein
MELKINGKVKVIMETQTFDSGFTKREFVVTTDEQYPQDVKLEFIKDKCDLLDSVAVDQNVTVSFNVRGNEYNGRYFVNLQAWRMETGNDSGSVTPETASQPAPMAEGEDDLPF